MADTKQRGARRTVVVEVYPMPAALGGGFGLIIAPPFSAMCDGFATVEDAKQWARSHVSHKAAGWEIRFEVEHDG